MVWIASTAARVGAFNTGLAAFLAQEATAQRHQTGPRQSSVATKGVGGMNQVVRQPWSDFFSSGGGGCWYCIG